MCFLKYLSVSVLLLSLSSAQKSPCPKRFLFEPNKSEEDRWFGVITLTSPVDIVGATLELHFDKSVTQLGNWFGKVEPNSDNTIFKIRNNKKTIKAHIPNKEEIFVVFDPYYDIPSPQLKKILLNDREICPSDDEIREQIVHEPVRITVHVSVPNCGIKKIYPTGLITNGQNTVEGQWPWHAALYRIEGKKRIYICGGTLISERHILTAAHCTTNKETDRTHKVRESNSISVTLGKYGTYVFGMHEQDISISNIIVHPEFSYSNFLGDISILVLSNPASVTDYVKPICLWEEGIAEDTVVNRTGTVVGWGRDENDNSITDLLMEAHMPVVNRLDCVLSHPTYYGKFTSDKTLCAGFRNGQSVCNGDSGGGLVFPKKGTRGGDTVWMIRGIVSNTVSKETESVCDPDYFVVFTDVAKYLEWLKEYIK